MNLRPDNFDNFIGQAQAVGLLKVKIKAALARGESLGHLLLLGPAGLGKTTLAKITAEHMGGRLLDTAGRSLGSPTELHRVIMSIQAGDILFIDEIHRLNEPCQEVLFRAMEDGETSYTIGEGENARIVPVKLPPFTLIGATNMGGQLTPAFQRRFVHQLHLDYYSVPELELIVQSKAIKLGLVLDGDGIHRIASVSRGEAFTAERIMLNLRDFAQARGTDTMDPDMISHCLHLLGISALGVTQLQVKLLEAVRDAGSLSLATIGHMLGEDPRVIAEIAEPYLMRLGLLDRTSKGRIITERGAEYLAGGLR